MKFNIAYLLTLLYCGFIFFFTYWSAEPDSQVESAHHKQEEESHEHKRADKPGELMRYQLEIRTREGATGPNLPVGYKSKALQELRQQASRNGTARVNATNFISRGPGNVPGRTRAVYQVPDGSLNTFLAGAATGGIWRTTNAGVSWSEQNNELNAYPVSSFASNSSGSRIYAGTGEYVSTYASALGDGIYVSTDLGITWAPLPSTQNNDQFQIVTRLVVNPANANEIVATTVTSDLSRSARVSRVMRSTNGGISWTVTLELDGALEQIVATPGNFSVQYAAENSVGVWKSTDAGITWNLTNLGMLPTGRCEIAVSPVDGNRVYVSSEGDYSGVGSDLYVSSDAGLTWGLANIIQGSSNLDFLGGQGFYDNTILCDPFNKDIIYFGGVSLFRSTIGAQSGSIAFYDLSESGTESFLFLQAFTNIPYSGQRLDSGSDTNQQKVEIRFGPGQTQLAHQFYVPVGATSGVAAANYTYQAYVSVPFTVWDVTNSASPRQLMVSFRDQNRNGFDLVPQLLGATDPAANQSREYLYIHNIDYSTTSSSLVAVAGGHEVKKMYGVFPCLASGAVWNPGSLPTSKISIDVTSLPKYNATTITSVDVYGAFDGKNRMDQVNLTAGVHADQHTMAAVITNSATKTYKILLGNDGGFFVSNESTEPGTTAGSWNFRGTGLTTSQFYGADKRPGVEEYIGGMQDNGTRKSGSGGITAASNYTYMLGGDGFEVLWNRYDGKKLLGSIYNGDIYRSTDGGTSWASAANGITPGGAFPFITRIAGSRDYPERVFTVSTAGVHRSDNFGSSWTTTAITTDYATVGAFGLQVEVSRANANIIWAGGGMRNNPSSRQVLHVSQDGGLTFSPTQNFTTVPMGSISGLTTHPTEPQTAYALFAILDGPKILRTKNLGQTWEDISGFNASATSSNGFPDVGVFSLYVHPHDTKTLWAGTEIGIMESNDDGASWHLLEEFPKVAVWSMEGQDNEVVIGTHGRGIWSAVFDEPQVNQLVPVLSAIGTAPNKALKARFSLPVAFDSLQVYVGTTRAGTVKNLTTGVFDVSIKGIGSGSRTVYGIAFRGGAPMQTATITTDKLNLSDPVSSYTSYFELPQDFIISGLTLQYFSGETNTRRVYQSQHPYDNSRNHSLVLRKPVIVSGANANVDYADIAITEPGKDQATLEATRNGLDWVTLNGPFDSSSDPQWTGVYAANGSATRSHARNYSIDLAESFTPGDTVILRWRMSSDATGNAWGYSLHYMVIQDVPLSENNNPITQWSVTPNPTDGEVKLRYTLTGKAPAMMEVIAPDGKLVTDLSKQLAPGTHELTWQMPPTTGIYFVRLRTGSIHQVSKIIRK